MPTSVAPTHIVLPSPALAPGDAGASGHYIASHDRTAIADLRPTVTPVTITFPNGTTATSTHIGHLKNIPASIPVSATIAHVFPPSTLATSLVSIPEFADAECEAVYTKSGLTIFDPQKQPVMFAPRSGAAGLWNFDLHRMHAGAAPGSASIPPGFETHPRAAFVSTVHSQSLAQRVAFIHKVFGAPALSTFIHAADLGFLASIPGFATAVNIRKHPPHCFATTVGHLDAARQHVRSTHPPDDPSPPATPRLHPLVVHVHDCTGAYAMDTSGALPAPGLQHKQYHVLMVGADPSYIHVEISPSRTAADLLRAVTAGVNFFTARGFTPRLEKLDNEFSADLEAYFASAGIVFELVPPNSHRRNPAERALRTWKNHFQSTLAVADPEFPFVQSARIVQHAELTLNLMRPSHINPLISAWEQLHGPFDFNRTPLAIPGMAVAVHEMPDARPSWAPHSIRGFYIGPAFHHYRCYTVWLPSTQETRVTDSIEWFPRDAAMPSFTPTEEAATAVRDLIGALSHLAAAPLPAAQRANLTALQPNLLDSLSQLHVILAPQSPPGATAVSVPDEQRVPAGPAYNLRSATTPGAARAHIGYGEYFSSHAAPRAPQHIPSHMPSPQTPTPGPPPPLPAPRPTPPTPAQSPRAFPDDARQQQRVLAHSPTIEPEERSAAPVNHQRLRQRRFRANANKRPVRAPAASAPHLADDEALPMEFHRYLALAATANASGGVLKYNRLVRTADADAWFSANADEWRRLISRTQTLRFAPASAKPAHQRATYINLVCTDKVKPPNAHSTKRVRATCGNGINYPGATAAETASLDTVKLLLNSVLSTPEAKFMTIDIKDFYLHSSLLRNEYAWVDLKQIAPTIIDEYSVRELAVHGKVLVEIVKGIYGLPQAGKLAKDQLTALLRARGFSECEHTPCLFKHSSRPIVFSLVVDDFGIKYTNRDDVSYLIDSLTPAYEITTDWSGSKYLGISLDWDYVSPRRSVALSLPGYVAKGLSTIGFKPSGKLTTSPGGFVRPQYGAHTQLTSIDTSPALPPEGRLAIQRTLGIFNWYLRVTDPSFKCRLSQLGAEQAHATEQTAAAVDHVLNYLHAFPNANLVYYASDMALQVESDASYNSEPKATSRAGGVFYLGKRTEGFVNGPIDETSVRIDAVMAAASEAEYAATFINARKACALRQTLSDLGHIQGPTPISVDNKCAQGLANDTVKRRQSKAIDMRFHWIRDRVRQGQFEVNWAPGKSNLADFFTKNLPAKQFQFMRLFFVRDIKPKKPPPGHAILPIRTT